MILSDVFFRELPSKCDVNVAWSCINFVLLPKLFPRINNVFELQQNKKTKSHAIWVSMKREFSG